MTFELPKLPYETDALQPYISKETLEFHYGKHHKGYVDKLNKGLEENDQLKDETLEGLIVKAKGSLFNNAAQVWNHTFYWNCMSPNGGGEPDQGELKKALEDNFNSFTEFHEEFTQKAGSLFGSGWTWLVKNEDGSLSIEQTKDAENPLREGKWPLLTCDVWEHAYYIDYRNARPKYIEAFWKVVNWEFVEKQLQKVCQTSEKSA